MSVRLANKGRFPASSPSHALVNSVSRRRDCAPESREAGRVAVLPRRRQDARDQLRPGPGYYRRPGGQSGVGISIRRDPKRPRHRSFVLRTFASRAATGGRETSGTGAGCCASSRSASCCCGAIADCRDSCRARNRVCAASESSTRKSICSLAASGNSKPKSSGQGTACRSSARPAPGQEHDRRRNQRSLRRGSVIAEPIQSRSRRISGRAGSAAGTVPTHSAATTRVWRGTIAALAGTSAQRCARGGAAPAQTRIPGIRRIIEGIGALPVSNRCRTAGSSVSAVGNAMPILPPKRLINRSR